MYNINISAVLNGWVAQVGCQTLVYNDLDALLKDLREYLTEPRSKIKTFLEGAVNRDKMANPVVARGDRPVSSPQLTYTPYPPAPAPIGDGTGSDEALPVRS